VVARNANDNRNDTHANNTRNDIHKKGQPQGIAPTVGDVVGAFQSIVNVKYIRGVKTKK